MKFKAKIALISIVISATLPLKAFPQQVDMNLKNMVPEGLDMIEDQYSSVVISFYMEQCVNNLFRSLRQNGFQPIFARKSAFQVCGCSMDTMRSDMPEKDYLDMLYGRNKMAQAMMESNLKACGEMYGDHFSKTYNTDPQT